MASFGITREGVAVLSDKVLAEVTPDSPDTIMGIAEVGFETMQLMAKTALNAVEAGDIAAVRKALNDSIEYGAFQRARIQSFDEQESEVKE